jgi:hypothetical protein
MNHQEYLAYEDRFVSVGLLLIFSMIYYFIIRPHQQREAIVEKAWADARQAAYDEYLQATAIPPLSDNDD